MRRPCVGRRGGDAPERIPRISLSVQEALRTRNVIPPCARWCSRSKKPFPMNTRLECRQSHSLRTSFSFSASHFSIFNFPFSIRIFPSLAQLDRVSDSDSEGRGFESRKTGQKNALAFVSAFFSYIRLAASDIAFGSDIRLRRVIFASRV